MSELVRYSKIKKKRNMHFLMKKYKASDNTILYDEGVSDVCTNLRLEIKDIKNLVIDTDTNDGINIHNLQVENIYFKDSPNLGGITIPINKIFEKSRGYYISWDEEDSNINQINIIGDKIKTIKVDNLESIQITRKDKYRISIEIEDKKTIIEYIINILGDIENIKKSYCITESDIVNNEIDLNNYIDYEEIIVDVVNKIKIDNLIINRNCMEYINKLYEAISYIRYKKLKIVDNNEMKLFPNIIELENPNNKEIEIFQTYGNIFYILYKREKLIYFDNNELKIIDKEKLLKDKNIELIKFYLEDKFHRSKFEPILIIKYKNNKTKISYFDETIKISKLFNWYNINKLYEYYHHDREEIKELLEKNDWYEMFNKRYIDLYTLKSINEDYLNFIKDIENLKKLGFNNNAIKYLYENNFDNITNFKKYKNNLNPNDMSKEEIYKFNELGNIYIKKKTLSK